MNTLFFRLLDAEDKGTALQEAIAALPQNPTPEAFAVNPEAFEQVPRSPFSYWVGERARKAFQAFESLDNKGFIASVGTSTKNDFCYLRCVWEVPSILITQNRESTLTGKEFAYFAKGGAWLTDKTRRQHSGMYVF